MKAKLFVSFCYVSMDNENALFSNAILEAEPPKSEQDLVSLEAELLEAMGEPPKFRWVQILWYKVVPE